MMKVFGVVKYLTPEGARILLLDEQGDEISVAPATQGFEALFLTPSCVAKGDIVVMEENLDEMCLELSFVGPHGSKPTVDQAIKFALEVLDGKRPWGSLDMSARLAHQMLKSTGENEAIARECVSRYLLKESPSQTHAAAVLQAQMPAPA